MFARTSAQPRIEAKKVVGADLRPGAAQSKRINQTGGLGLEPHYMRTGAGAYRDPERAQQLLRDLPRGPSRAIRLRQHAQEHAPAVAPIPAAPTHA